MFTPNASAIRNASSSDGEYLPASMEMMVCLEAPAFSASSCWVISFAKNRNLRMLFVIANFLGMVYTLSVKIKLGEACDQRTADEGYEHDVEHHHRGVIEDQ